MSKRFHIVTYLSKYSIGIEVPYGRSKQVELELYSGLPYLLWPIIHESEKAIKLLKWAVAQMEKRYGLLKEKRVKNIDEYNAKIMGDKMFRIVIVIDELAELMLSSKNRKEVERYITRIAQKARAIGMHLIVATQRPSVDVITGTYQGKYTYQNCLLSGVWDR
jgi:S-DNA-T family DNA segregation ATPase FtsK/SpoIIIE